MAAFSWRLPAEFVPVLWNVLKEGYSRRDLAKDVVAGLIVGVISLPLALAFAIASGVSPGQGLTTAIIAGILTALLGGSRFQVSGPTGAFIVIVYGIVQQYGYAGLATATFIAGMLLVVMGFARFGSVLQYMPYPVIVGFTSGIALIIATGQLPSFLGLRIVNDPADWVHKVALYASHWSDVDPWNIGVGFLALGITGFWSRWTKGMALVNKLPGSLVALLVTTALVHIAALPVATIGDRFGNMPTGLQAPHIPAISFDLVRAMIQPALTIAMLSGIESLLSAVVADGMTGYRHKSNMELVAHGVANMASPLFGGVPSTGAIARTATNIRNGARSPVSSLVHALLLLLILLFLGSWARLVPMPTLAAILLVVAYHMSEWRVFLKLFKAPASDVAILLMTFVLTVVVDLTVAIEVGVLAGAILFIRRMSEVSRIDMNVPVLRDEGGKDPMALTDREVPERVLVSEIQGVFFFGAIEKFRSLFGSIDGQAAVLILRMRSVAAMDSSGIRFLEELQTRCRKYGTTLVLSGLQPQPREVLDKSGFLAELGAENNQSDIDRALDRAREILGLACGFDARMAEARRLVASGAAESVPAQ